MCEQVLADLDRWRFLDDEGLARDYARERAKGSRWGKVKILAHLERAGAPAEVLERLEAEFDDREEEARARAALERKFPHGVDRARAYRFLWARGFDEEVVRAVIEDLPAEEASHE